MAGLLIFFFFHMQFQKTQLWKRLFLWWNYILVMRFDTVFLTLETMSEEIALPHIYSFSTPFFPTVSSEREREKLCSNGISERIPQALPSPPTPFLSLLMYDFKLCQRFSQRHPSCFTFLYKGTNPTPHPSRQDIGFFLVGRCCSQCVIPGGYFRFLVLLSVLSGGNRWSVFEILNPF